MLRLVQIACIVITVAFTYGVVKGFDSLRYVIGNDFSGGFIVGVLFVVALYLVICWLDPSSRPRGSGIQHQGFDKRID
ncbi:hypothetical protein QO004_000456 [Rhizobium mesoamericanum]|uniref:hypothetical protein n=1 Tax=Rhizobium mesoamericanum TaxID=1079800 RepID=UPI00277ED8F3|nr:hypothetical protein [Rhizobium mesoamericanum]MDQ0558681.1 hypothetical protein [Rhizobium mesoamericanum]